jgi:hypothetical protein
LHRTHGLVMSRRGSRPCYKTEACVYLVVLQGSCVRECCRSVNKIIQMSLGTEPPQYPYHMSIALLKSRVSEMSE